MTTNVSSTAASPRRPWTPGRTDHLIYTWVKMEGRSQSWVAAELRISQSTVSRVIQRYERWNAHAQERQDGRLDHAERLRAQRSLTFERNELILSSCLRIASDLEGFVDTSKSTISRLSHSYAQEKEIRTHHATVDRTGTVARFLRLAFRINMEQLKLAELDPPPAAQPLTDEELDQQDRDIEIANTEFAAAHLNNMDVVGSAPSAMPSDPIAPTPPSPSPTCNVEPETCSSSPPLHNLHNAPPPEYNSTPSPPCTCAIDDLAEKNSLTCITPSNPPPSTSDDDTEIEPSSPLHPSSDTLLTPDSCLLTPVS